MKKEELNEIANNVGAGLVSAHENKLHKNRSNVGVAWHATGGHNTMMPLDRGITLISLIITIIILLILAGVTINLTIGENGIFKTANRGTEEYRKQVATEKINLKITNSQINVYTKEQRMPTLQELANDFCEDNEIEYVQASSNKLASIDKIDLGNKTSFFTKLKDYPYEFEINSSLQLASIDGVKIANLPKNEGDSIISMTKSELQELINTSIDNALKNYSTTKENDEKYATRNEVCIPTLDWNNRINITSNLKAIGGSYIAPKNGIIRVVLDQNDKSDCALILRTNAIGGLYKKYYANSSTNWATFTDEFEINKSDSVTVASDSILDGFRNFYIEFIPYK